MNIAWLCLLVAVLLFGLAGLLEHENERDFIGITPALSLYFGLFFQAFSFLIEGIGIHREDGSEERLWPR